MRTFRFFFPLLSIILLFLAACGASGTPNATSTLNPVIEAKQTLDALATQTALAVTATALPPTDTPVIISTTPQPTATNTNVPTNTPISTNTSNPINTSAPTNVVVVTNTPSPTPAPRCDWAFLVKDVTVPVGSPIRPSQSFTKTWRLENIGTCTWSTSYTLIFYGGEKMSGPASVKIPSKTAPGQTVDVSVNLTSPASRGQHQGYWILKNANGVLFGLGDRANGALSVDINVISPLIIAYDFADHYCSADWTSAAGALPCPGSQGTAQGYVIYQASPRLENGSIGTWPGLLAHPQNISNGYISGKFPIYIVQSGDRFQTWIGCQPAASSCDVYFRLDYVVEGKKQIKTLASWHEVNEGLYYPVDVDLSPLVNKPVHFILTVISNGSPIDDEAFWFAPLILRSHPATPTFTPTPTP